MERDEDKTAVATWRELLGSLSKASRLESASLPPSVCDDLHAGQVDLVGALHALAQGKPAVAAQLRSVRVTSLTTVLERIDQVF